MIKKFLTYSKERYINKLKLYWLEGEEPFFEQDKNFNASQVCYF